MSVFFTYGADNSYTHQFSQANMARQNAQAGLTEAAIPTKLAEALNSMGVHAYGYQP